MSKAITNEDARYRESSHFRLWTFSISALAAKRRTANTTARVQISDQLSRLWDSQTEHKPKEPEFLSPEDELALVTFNTNELLRAGAFLEFPIEVLATGAVLFRRFYVMNSIMTYNPQQVLKICLFLAAKIELGFDRIARRFEQLPNTKLEEIIAGEAVVAMACRFAYDVRHPFRGLEGAVLELRRLGDVDEKRLTAAREHARTILKFSPLMTDAYFHYVPSQIMFAALSIADRGLADRLLDMLFQPYDGEGDESGINTPTTSSGSDNIVAAREKVSRRIASCRDMLKTEMPGRGEFWSKGEGLQKTKPLRRRLNKDCHDLDKWDLLKLQQSRREEAAGDMKSGEDEDKKKNFMNEDPFGPNLE